MEHHVITRVIRDVIIEQQFDPCHKDILFDLKLRKEKDVDIKLKTLQSMNGWNAPTWIRDLSCNCWHQGCTFDVDDILVDNLVYSTLLPSQRITSDGRLAFKNLFCSPSKSTKIK